MNLFDYMRSATQEMARKADFFIDVPQIHKFSAIVLFYHETARPSSRNYKGRTPVSALGALPAGVVDGILPAEEDLRDGDEGIALLEEGLDDGGQGLRGMEGGVVEQDDGAGLDLGGHPLDDLSGGQVLPVQAVHERNDRKFLPDKCTFLMPI